MMPQACKVSFDEPLAFHFLRSRIMPYQFTTDMKNILVLSMLVSSVMICSCERKDSAAQQQLAQRTVELDAREEALAERKGALDDREKTLDERQKALDQRQKALAQKEKAAVTNPTDVQGQTSGPAQMQAARDTITQQLSVRAPEPSQLRAEKESEIQQQSQRQLEEFQRERERVRQLKLTGAFMSGGAAYPAASATSPTPPPAEEATSPSPSQTPE